MALPALRVAISQLPPGSVPALRVALRPSPRGSSSWIAQQPDAAASALLVAATWLPSGTPPKAAVLAVAKGRRPLDGGCSGGSVLAVAPVASAAAAAKTDDGCSAPMRAALTAEASMEPLPRCSHHPR
eukprot:CAMPEP_0115708678 /NCGR_PEP_ID=MMETSP0272-20121206/72044_1 /TAXON_ID=71861 /ORGANISM="Scrippsiella trochoidea, Strain CCMP3099" /LENGTH=127 /DNA_ID=CAMNT_0003150193 /DNA_START=64 /DNA_END=444 /DNA_ORIENTATION=-